MPSIASHYAVANKVSNIINNKSDEFMLGNILPDIIDLPDSHFKIRGSYYLISDIDKFIANQKYSKDILIGYLTHLLLDKYFLEEYVPNNIPNYKEINLFSKNFMYQDYTNVNYILINKFGIDVQYINKLLTSKLNFPIDSSKLEKNYQSINSKLVNNPKLINLERYCIFLDQISLVIANDISLILKKINYQQPQKEFVLKIHK